MTARLACTASALYYAGTTYIKMVTVVVTRRCGRFDDSGCVDRPVVSLLGVDGHVVGDIVVSHVGIRVVQLGGASSLSSCCDGHSLAD